MGSSYNDALSALKSWRDNNERKSRQIFDIWVNYLAPNFPNFGRDKHVILEQIIIAALDCDKLGTAKKCIEELYREFPKSLRIRTYESMYMEANGHCSDALNILDGIIQQDESHSGARKRKVALYKSQGCIVEAIRELSEYLKIFMADTEAWQELGDLYLFEQEYAKAAFCLEELILHNPHNHLYHQRYADIKYTQGGLENFELAKAYYSQAIYLCPRNLRALYGLYLSCTAIANSPKCPIGKKKEATKMYETALLSIKTIYEEKDVHAHDVELRLAALQLN